MNNIETNTSQSVAYPLDEFYARTGLALPPLDQVDGEAVPEPYKSLLVHERDMTSTLENFHKTGIHLRLVSRQQRGDEYFREVVLVLDRSGSMDGAPLTQAKAVASAIIDTLCPRDSFNIVAFASGVDAMADRPIAGDPSGKQRGVV